MYKKARCTCKVVVLLKNPFACVFLSLAGKIKIQTVVNTSEHFPGGSVQNLYFLKPPSSK